MSEDTMQDVELADYLLERVASPEEVAKSAGALVGLMKEQDDLEAEKDITNDGFKKRLKKIEGGILTHRQAIERGVIHETVRAEYLWDAKEAKVTIRDPKNGEVLKERAMTAQELEARRQLHLAPAPPPDNLESFCSECTQTSRCPQHAVSAVYEKEDVGACPDDPDGVHHVGCGCDYTDEPEEIASGHDGDDPADPPPANEPGSGGGL